MPTKHDVLIDLIRREAADKNILSWGKLLFPEKFNLPFCQELHGYLVETRKAAFSNTEAPRNHAKTLIECFLIPLFQALEEPGEYRHYLNVQSTSTKAASVNLAIRAEIENNELLQEVYDNLVNPEKWTEKQFSINSKCDGKTMETIFTAIGAGESMRGINYKNIRPDYIIVDDLYDDEDINNIESTKKKNAWFWGSLYLARAKSKACSIHVQGTAINDSDLLESLKKDEKVISRTFQAIKDAENKIVLWPELNTFDQLMQDKADTRMGSIIFDREMQNKRRSSASVIFRCEWFKHYSVAPIFKFRFITADTAQKTKERNDYSVFAAWGVADGRLYLIDLIRGRWEAPDLKRKAKAFWDKHKAAESLSALRKMYVEDKASGTGLIQEIKRDGGIPIEAIQRNIDKYTRALDIQGQIESGYVFLPEGAPFVSDFLEECEAFSADDSHAFDDQVDVMMDAINKGLSIKKTNWAKAAENVRQVLG
jgi:predicted phage terminase large subunit-like protein